MEAIVGGALTLLDSLFLQPREKATEDYITGRFG